ncbi:unnamed protein product [Ilex paraguariensis]|uniref:Uncharacterized protein n=1 Tax=Ilex paraguariensis TaxID=185542 RepID=A0ABC8QVS6_9AQUA
MGTLLYHLGQDWLAVAHTEAPRRPTTRGLKHGRAIVVSTCAAVASIVTGVLAGMLALGERLPSAPMARLSLLLGCTSLGYVVCEGHEGLSLRFYYFMTLIQIKASNCRLFIIIGVILLSDLKRLEAQSMEEGATPMIEDKRFEVVLGLEKSGYIRGRGAGPKPTTSTTGQRIRVQLEKESEGLKRQAETNRLRWELLEKENNDLTLRLMSLKPNIDVEMQTQVHVVLQTQLITFFLQMKELGKFLPLFIVIG